MMLPSAMRVAITYLKAMVWIQLWAPLYAVLHFAMTFFSQSPSEAALLLPDGSTVLSLANYTGLRQVMADTALIAGYLSLSIPMISYLVVNQGGAMIANLATRVGQSYEAPVSKGAEEATTGNISLGNTSLGKADWWAQNLNPTWRSGVQNLVDTIGVRHVSGGISWLGLKSYDQGRRAFQGTGRHVIWFDEEPPMSVYNEALIRTATLDGLVIVTFTPLLGLSEVVLSFLPADQRPDLADDALEDEGL